MTQIVLIAHNLRSTYNVGSILRTADGLGASVYLTGYTPYPAMAKDVRMPHLISKINKQIAKTSLGAEKTLKWRHHQNANEVIASLKNDGYTVAALEQTKNAVPLPSYKPPAKLALIVGREVEGLEPEVLEAVDLVVQIPMHGNKESFNVAVAAGMALYQARFARIIKKS